MKKLLKLFTSAILILVAVVSLSLSLVNSAKADYISRVWDRDHWIVTEYNNDGGVSSTYLEWP